MIRKITIKSYNKGLRNNKKTHKKINGQICFETVFKPIKISCKLTIPETSQIFYYQCDSVEESKMLFDVLTKSCSEEQFVKTLKRAVKLNYLNNQE